MSAHQSNQKLYQILQSYSRLHKEEIMHMESLKNVEIFVWAQVEPKTKQYLATVVKLFEGTWKLSFSYGVDFIVVSEKFLKGVELENLDRISLFKA